MVRSHLRSITSQTRCVVSMCTGRRLADKEMSDWFLFYFVETYDQLRNSAKYLTHEGVLEIPDGGLSEMELQKREQFLQKFHILAYDAMDDYGASVWVGHEDNSQLYLVQDLTGRLPSISADELKELVASALEQACKFHMTEDLDVGKLEESHASLSS